MNLVKKELLTITGPYGPDGYVDSDGVEHYNDIVMSAYGPVDNLVVEDGVCLAAPNVTLLRRGFGVEWTDPLVEVSTTPFGVPLLTLYAKNGWVSYRLIDTRLAWAFADKYMPNDLENFQLGVKVVARWAPGPEPTGGRLRSWSSTTTDITQEVPEDLEEKPW
ncbi:hypothetical protein [Mycolicibacterium palauense]|uniref:hypothetical protein n=1 Tax=Mycolicibacterium palauense TaxID=2034511 RepID=UPI00114570D6|nr:hypothetical protein [Mycolicibacterium palauense]